MAVAKMFRYLWLVAALHTTVVEAFIRQIPPSSNTHTDEPTTSPPTPTPVIDHDDVFSGGCDSNWMQTRDDYNAAVEVWTDPQCYNMIYERFCECLPGTTGPFEVRVRNGIVVEDNAPPDVPIPTMSMMLQTIFRNCVETCPDKGAHSCSITYGPAGNAVNVQIDIDPDLADEEISFAILGFRICDP